jgi:hypothetical protein
MRCLRIKVIIMSLKPNKIVKTKKYFGLNIGRNLYYKKTYLTRQISYLNFVPSNGENDENENEDSKNHQLTGG